MNRYLVKIADAKDLRDTATIGAIGAATGLAGVKAIKRFPKLGSSNAKIMGITGGLGLLGDFAAVKANKAMEKKAAIDVKKLKGTDRALHAGIESSIHKNPNTPKSERRELTAIKYGQIPAAVGATLLTGKYLGPSVQRLVGKKRGILASKGVAAAAGLGTALGLSLRHKKLSDTNTEREFKKYASYKDSLTQREKYIYEGAKVRMHRGEDKGVLPAVGSLSASTIGLGGVVGGATGLNKSRDLATKAARKAHGHLQADPISNRAKNHGVRSSSRAVVVAPKTATPIHNTYLNKAHALRKSKRAGAAYLATRVAGAVLGTAAGATPGILGYRAASNAHGKKQVELSRKSNQG